MEYTNTVPLGVRRRKTVKENTVKEETAKGKTDSDGRKMVGGSALDKKKEKETWSKRG